MNTFNFLYRIYERSRLMDRRQARTRQAIIDAFVTLLDKSSYEKISVKEIIDTANVGRSTFYSHFETKDDLACQICNNLFEHIFSHVIPPCSTHNFSEVEPCAETRITHILYHLRDKRKYYLGIIRHEDGALFLHFFRDFMMKRISIKATGVYQEMIQSMPEDFMVNSLASSFIGMVHWWLKDNMQTQPETVAKYYMTLINPAIAEFEAKE